jgi:hypothetical protein
MRASRRLDEEGNTDIREEDLVVDGRIILEWILREDRRCGLDSSGSG